MRNIIILGSGRSGTSMAAGLFARAGYFMGDDLYSPTTSNPKGFFENKEINDINEELISGVRGEGVFRYKYFSRYRPKLGQKWIARVGLNAKFRTDETVLGKIKKLTGRHPFCLKDPRFSYTLPVWRPFLGDAVYLCVFRHPSLTVQSILKECREVDYLRDLKINEAIASEVWYLQYAHIIRNSSDFGDWVFIHYDQIANGEAFDHLEKITGATVDRSFPQKDISQSRGIQSTNTENLEIYAKLCDLARLS